MAKQKKSGNGKFLGLFWLLVFLVPALVSCLFWSISSGLWGELPSFEELENPNPTMERSDENESIEEKMSDSSDQIKQDKNKKASQNQQDAAEEMKQMAQQMESMMQQAEEESMEEDMDALRALLENIIQLSFDEEDVMASLGQINEDDPLYITSGLEKINIPCGGHIFQVIACIEQAVFKPVGLNPIH